MHRVDGENPDEDLHGAGKDGFTAGNPVIGEPPTEVTDDWLNAIQEEIAKVIETGGAAALVKADNTQLYTAVLKMIRGPTTGTNPDGTGLAGVGGPSDGIGVTGQGDGTGSGVEGTGGETGFGVRGIGGATSGSGVKGEGTASTATGVWGVGGANGRGGYFQAQGTGDGLRGDGVDGYGVVAVSDTSSPAKSALRILPQDADPSSSPAAGDAYVNSGNNKLRLHDGAAFLRYVPQTYAIPSESTAVSNNSAKTAFDRSYTIPANALQVGSTIRVRGQISAALRDASEDYTFGMRLGSVDVVTSATITGNGAQVIDFDFVVVVTAVGATGACRCTPMALRLDNGSGTMNGVRFATPTNSYAIDTTGTLALELWIDFVAADPGNIAFLNILSVDIT